MYEIFIGTSLLISKILMSAKFNWIPSRNGNVPAEAIKAGITDKGETLFVGRCLHNGVPVIGKVKKASIISHTKESYFTFFCLY